MEEDKSYHRFNAYTKTTQTKNFQPTKKNKIKYKKTKKTKSKFFHLQSNFIYQQTFSRNWPATL